MKRTRRTLVDQAVLTIDLNRELDGHGTRFLVYPQSPALQSVTLPETIWVSPPPGAVVAGPADDQMYVVDAIGKRAPYGESQIPPYVGPSHAAALPDAHGHYDHLKPGTRQFEAAHMYAVIRRVLDVWECYLGHPVRWHFDVHYSRLELIPQLEWDNAQSGYGFIESGSVDDEQGESQLYCLNFDILAHEIGHSIIYSVVGVPDGSTATPEYYGFQESAADMTAFIAVLHFDSVVERLLDSTSGNLYSLNELNRFAEKSDVDQVRIASNDRRMSHYAEGWKKEHDLSLPLTGALFDLFIELFHSTLLESDLIDAELAAAAYDSILPGADAEQLQFRFDEAYEGRHHDFKQALLQSRDYFGALLAASWSRLSPHGLSYVDVAQALLDADRVIGYGAWQAQILECFKWRQIGAIEPGPRLSVDSGDGSRSCR